MKSLGTLAICCALAAPAAGESRFHLLTPALTERLGPMAQRTTGAIAKLRRATAFLVAHDPSPTAHGLVLTNYHVAGTDLLPREKLRFLDGTKARTVRLIAANADLDYALVEVALPWGTKAMALPLRPEPITPSRPIYSAAAYAALKFPTPSQAIGGGPRAYRAIATQRGSFAIALGQLDPNNTRPVSISFPTSTVTAFESVLPNAPGMSGSPVLARDTHGVIGLHTSGNARPGPWQESAVPVGLILKDLEAKRDAGGFDPAAARLVNELFLGAL